MGILQYFNLNTENLKTVEIEKQKLAQFDEGLSHEQKRILDESIESIHVVACLKATKELPGYMTDRQEYKEILFLEIQLKDYSDYIRVPPIVFYAIKYPTVLLLKYKSKYKIATCLIHDKKREPSKNTVPKSHITFWIYPNNPSQSAKDFLSSLDIKKALVKDIWDLYNYIDLQVLFFRQKAFSRAAAERLLDYLQCGDYTKQLSEFCTYTALNKHAWSNNKYRKKYTESLSRYQFDHGDIWQFIMITNDTRKAILKRKIKTMEELIYCYDEYTDRHADESDEW